MDIQEKEEYQEKIGSPEMEYLQYQIENPQIQSKTMDINKIIEEQKEEFDKKFPELYGSCDGREGYDSYEKDNVFNWHIQSLIKFLDTEIERLKELKKEELEISDMLMSEYEKGNDLGSGDCQCSFDQEVSSKIVVERIIDDQISHLQDIKSQLSK